MNEHRPILILGMHRSGTSCLAGSLESAGLFLGSVNTSAPFNRKGNREHESIRDIHDEVLSDHGYAWDNPPTYPLNWSAPQIDRLRQRAKSLSQASNWGLKDPRLAFCLKGWKEVFDPRYVVTYRHPTAVANSLVSRSLAWGREMSVAAALDLWVSYNTQILAETSDERAEVIRYDVDQSAYMAQLDSVCARFNLDAALAKTFYSETLNHQKVTDPEVPAVCQNIWNELETRRQVIASV